MLVKQKYLKLMPDYSSTGLWNENGANVEYDYAPISETLVAAIKCWCYAYEMEFRSGSDDIYPYYSKLGLELAKCLKTELPDWKIVYYDEYKSATCTERDLYEYEIERK